MGIHSRFFFIIDTAIVEKLKFESLKYFPEDLRNYLFDLDVTGIYFFSVNKTKEMFTSLKNTLYFSRYYFPKFKWIILSHH